MSKKAQLALWRARLAWRERRLAYWKRRKNVVFAEKWNNLRLQAIREINRLKTPTGPITMYDSITVTAIPANAPAVAGYVGGKWPTYKSLLVRFPGAKHLSIAINSSEDAECLDVETGDAEPSQAPAWCERQKKRGVKRPCLYANLSTMPAVIAALNTAKIPRGHYRLWVAHYTGVPHIEPGFDATQYTDKALGRNLDASLCAPTFFL